MSRPEDLLPEFGLQPDGYRLTEVQANQILEMRLSKLTGLEQDKLTEEYRDILVTIRGLIEILENPERLLSVIRTELAEVKEAFGDARKTQIQRTQEDLSLEDLITPEDMVLTLSHAGYAKAQPVATYRAQKRGGKGRSATAIKEEDFIERILVAHSHDTVLCFTSGGRVFWLKTYQFPQAGPNSKGRPIVNLLPKLEGDEKVNAMLPVKEYSEDRYVFFATKQGVVKKTPLADFSRPRSIGIRAVELDEGDRLIDVAITDGSRDVLLFASNGKAVRFSEDAVRSMGRGARGVRGMTLAEVARIVSMIVAEEGDILCATERGFGKRTPLDEYPRKGRGTQGVIAIQTSDRNGCLVGATQVREEHEIMLISNQGTLVRTRASEVAQVGRNTQGVTLIRLPSDEKLVGVERVESIAEAVEELENELMSGGDDASDVALDPNAAVANEASLGGPVDDDGLADDPESSKAPDSE